MLSSVSLVTGANDSTRLSIPDLNIWRGDGRLISGSDDCTTRIMPRLVLQLVVLSNGTLVGCCLLLTLPMAGISSSGP